MMRFRVSHFLKATHMKCNKALATGKEMLNRLLNRWDERCVRPRCSGWIRDILPGYYPTKEIRSHLRIGGKGNKEITYGERVFMFLCLLRTYGDWLYAYKKMRKMTVRRAANVKKIEDSESHLLEKYISIKFIVLLVLLWAPVGEWYPTGAKLIGVFILWEVIGLLFYPLTVVFVDRYKYDREKKAPYCYWAPHSFNRSILFVLWGYIEMIIAFAYLYRHFGFIWYADCGAPIRDAGEALYFSIVTITTLGYGDMVPGTGLGRILTGLQPVMGIILLVFVVGLFFLERRGERTIESKDNK